MFRLFQGFIQAAFGGNFPPQTSEISPVSEVRMMASCSDYSDHSLSRATVTLESRQSSVIYRNLR